MVFAWVGQVTGIGENVVRLLTSILLGYPIAQVYRLRFLGAMTGISKQDAVQVRNNYLVVAGLSLSFLYNGWDIYHSLITVMTTYGLCYFVGGVLKNRFLSAALIFLFNVVYLTVGYYFNCNGDYDLTWTMPQCVLCLRMIGFGLDYYDGENKTPVDQTKEPETLKPSVEKLVTKEIPNKPAPKVKTVSFSGDCALAELPRFDQFLGYAYFFSAFLVGPQFSFSLYHRFINAQNLTLDARGFAPGGAVTAAKNCLLVGIGYLALQQVLSGFAPLIYVSTPEFLKHSFLYRVVYMWFSGKGVVTKYLGVWTLNEGACVLSGISFNGFDAQGKAEWNGLTNMDWKKFESATSLDDIIGSFNINTNLWIKDYVFKRLRFLKNKNLSQMGSLVFLALWHGFLSGYFMCFTLEFVDMSVEKQMKAAVSPYTSKLYRDKSPLRYLITVACYIYTSSALFYAIVAFGLLRHQLYVPAYNSVYWIGHIALLTLSIACQTVLKPPCPTKITESEVTKKQK